MQHISGQKIFGAVVVIAVVAAIAYGIFLAGAPSQERQRKLDDQRVQHLQQISSVVNQYYAEKKTLPENLSVLLNRPTTYFESVVDPETKAPYEYLLLDPPEYRLCAVFRATTSDEPDWRTMHISWTHPSGRYCFLLNASLGSVVGVPPVHEAIPAPCVGNCSEESVKVPLLERPDTTCRLMRSKGDGSMHCVACTGNGFCRDAAADWEFYDMPSAPGYVGIPYGCTMTETGCALVQ